MGGGGGCSTQFHSLLYDMGGVYARLSSTLYYMTWHLEDVTYLDGTPATCGPLRRSVVRILVCRGQRRSALLTGGVGFLWVAASIYYHDTQQSVFTIDMLK